MKELKGKSRQEIDPYFDERKKIYVKISETLIVSSLNYMNDFAKFMIGLNSTLLTAYIAFIKLLDSEFTILKLLPFIFQIITILLFMLTLYPRESMNNSKKPFIFNPERILEIYSSSIKQKMRWGKLGTISFLLYLVIVIIATTSTS